MSWSQWSNGHMVTFCQVPKCFNIKANFPSQAGIIEEMVEEAMDQMEDDDIEEAADKEIENVLWELTKGISHTM